MSSFHVKGTYFRDLQDISNPLIVHRCGLGMEDGKFAGRSSKRKIAEQFEKQFFKSENLHTNLKELLSSLWVWGQISTSQVQKIAKTASNDLHMAFKKNLNEWDVLSNLGSNWALISFLYILLISLDIHIIEIYLLHFEAHATKVRQDMLETPKEI